MEDKRIIAPEKFIVGFQLRSNPGTTQHVSEAYQYNTKFPGEIVTWDYKKSGNDRETLFTDYDSPLYYRLGFATFKDKSKLRKEKSWTDWCWERLGTQEFDNVPTSGFRIAEVTQRSSEWFGSGRNMWEVHDPRGFRLEITSDNLMALLENTNIINGVFSEPMVWAWSGASMALVSTNSDLYQTTLANTARIARKVSARDIKPGYRIRLKNGKEGTYMGKFHSFVIGHNYRHGRYNYEWKTPLIHFIEIDKSEDNEYMNKPENRHYRIDTVSTLEVSDILEANELPSNHFLEDIRQLTTFKYGESYQCVRYANGNIVALSETPIDVANSYKTRPMTAEEIDSFMNDSIEKDYASYSFQNGQLIKVSRRKGWTQPSYYSKEKQKEKLAFYWDVYTNEEQTEKRILWKSNKEGYSNSNEIKANQVGDLGIGYIETSFGNVEIPMYFY